MSVSEGVSQRYDFCLYVPCKSMISDEEKIQDGICLWIYGCVSRLKNPRKSRNDSFEEAIGMISALSERNTFRFFFFSVKK